MKNRHSGEWRSQVAHHGPPDRIARRDPAVSAGANGSARRQRAASDRARTERSPLLRRGSLVLRRHRSGRLRRGRDLLPRVEIFRELSQRSGGNRLAGGRRMEARFDPRRTAHRGCATRRAPARREEIVALTVCDSRR